MLKTIFGYFLFISILIVFSADIFAQSIRFGIRGGLNYADASIKSLRQGVDNTPATRVMLGGIAILPISENFDLQFEPMYLQKGTQLNIPYLFGLAQTINAYYSYFDIPINVKKEFELGSFNPYIFGGGSLGFLISSKLKSEKAGNVNSEDVSKDIKSTDLALDIGVGLRNELSPNLSLILDIRYSYGLIDISIPKSIGAFGTTWKSNDIKSLIGVVFNL